MSTKKHLELMARCNGLGVDGTFQSCPKQWYQLLVITGEVSKSHWVPLMYIFCLNKTGSTYTTIFSAIKDKLTEEGLQLSAQYFMADLQF